MVAYIVSRESEDAIDSTTNEPLMEYYEFGGQRWGIYPVMIFDKSIAERIAKKENGVVVKIRWEVL